MSTAKIKYHKREWRVPSGETIRATIESIGVDPLSVLALRDKRLLRDDVIIEPGDEIKLVNVVSGG